MFFSKENLALASVASTEESRYALSGIYVDPQKNVTVASDGRRLVEITAPKLDAKSYPASGVTLTTGETHPFIFPAQSAKELLKILPKGKDASDIAQYAALAKKGDKLAIVTVDGRKTHTFDFDPIDGQFPDYQVVFPKEKPIASVTLVRERLQSTLKSAGIGETIQLHVYGNLIVIESDSESGLKSRGILMGCEVRSISSSKAEPKEAADSAAKASKVSEAPKTDAPKKEEPKGSTAPVKAEEKKAAPAKPVPGICATCGAEIAKTAGTECGPCYLARTKKVDETPSPAKVEGSPAKPESGTKPKSNFRGFRRFGHWKGKRPGATSATPGQPTVGQRALHTFLIRTRGGDVTLEDLQETKVSEKIEELKAQPSVENSFATWPQWRKLYELLSDQKADLATVAKVLNSVTSIKETSSAIDQWLKKTATAAA